MDDKSRHDIRECWEGNAEAWTRLSRAGYDIYRDALNTPSFMAILPVVDGLRGLDVGCGEGSNTRMVARRGARMTGVDIASNFITRAVEQEEREPLGIAYCQADAIALPFKDLEFDFAVAFMSLMDTGDPCRALQEVSRLVRPGGFFQFSILHPCFAPPHRKVLRDETGNPYAVEVADYFAVGRHYEEWTFGRCLEEGRGEKPFRVPYTHFTLGLWLDAILEAGFQLEKLSEPMASSEAIAQAPEVADTAIAPLFLHLRVTKP